MLIMQYYAAISFWLPFFSYKHKKDSKKTFTEKGASTSYKILSV